MSYEVSLVQQIVFSPKGLHRSARFTQCGKRLAYETVDEDATCTEGM